MTDPNTTPGDEQTATLLVDRTSSACGGCGQPTLPSALTHANVSGYDPKPGGGCGARFVAIRSVNRAVTEGHLRSMRPDLPVDTGGEQQTADRPYTDADLRAEAARQHAGLTEDPDYMGIGEQMGDRFVRYEVVDPEHGGQMPAPGSPRWDDLDEEQFDDAQRKIHGLITGAVCLSDWAVDLGADGLVPDGHVITIGGEQTAARIHFAFAPGLDDGQRAAIVHAVAHHVGDCDTCAT